MLKHLYIPLLLAVSTSVATAAGSFSPTPNPTTTNAPGTVPSTVTGLLESQAITGMPSEVSWPYYSGSYWYGGYGYSSDDSAGYDRYWNALSEASSTPGTRYRGGFNSRSSDGDSSNYNGESWCCSYYDSSSRWSTNSNGNFNANADYKGYILKTGITSHSTLGRTISDSIPRKSFPYNGNNTIYNDPERAYTEAELESTTAYNRRKAGFGNSWYDVTSAYYKYVFLHVIDGVQSGSYYSNSANLNYFTIEPIVVSIPVYQTLLGRGMEQEVFATYSYTQNSTGNATYNYTSSSDSSSGCGSSSSQNTQQSTNNSTVANTHTAQGTLAYITASQTYGRDSSINSGFPVTKQFTTYRPYYKSLSSNANRLAKGATRYKSNGNGNSNSNGGCYGYGSSSSSSSDSSTYEYNTETKLKSELTISASDRLGASVRLYFNYQNNRFAAVADSGYSYYYYYSATNLEGNPINKYPNHSESYSSKNTSTNSSRSNGTGGSSYYNYNSTAQSTSTTQASSNQSEGTYTSTSSSSWSMSSSSGSDGDSDNPSPYTSPYTNYFRLPHLVYSYNGGYSILAASVGGSGGVIAQVSVVRSTYGSGSGVTPGTVSLSPVNAVCPVKTATFPGASSTGWPVSYSLSNGIGTLEYDSGSVLLTFTTTGTSTLSASWGPATNRQNASVTVSYTGVNDVSANFNNFSLALSGKATTTIAPQSNLSSAIMAQFINKLSVQSGTAVVITGTDTVTTVEEGVSVIRIDSEQACRKAVSYVTITVTKKAMTLTFAPGPCLSSPVPLGATSTNNELLITYDILYGPPGSNAYIANNQLITTISGSYGVLASQAGDDLHTDAVSVSTIFEVSNAVIPTTTGSSFVVGGVNSTSATGTNGTWSYGLTSSNQNEPTISVVSNTSNAQVDSSTSTVTWTRPGTLVLLAEYPASGCYAATSATISVTLAGIQDAIIFAPPAVDCTTTTVDLSATSQYGLPVSYKIISDTTSSYLNGSLFVWSQIPGTVTIQAYTLDDVMTDVQGTTLTRTLTFTGTTTPVNPVGSTAISIKEGESYDLPAASNYTYTVTSGSAIQVVGNRILGLQSGVSNLRLSAAAKGCDLAQVYNITVTVSPNLVDTNADTTFTVVLQTNGAIVITALPPLRIKYVTEADLTSPVTLTVRILDTDMLATNKLANVKVFITDSAQATKQLTVLSEVLNPASLASWTLLTEAGKTYFVRNISVVITDPGFTYWGATYQYIE